MRIHYSFAGHARLFEHPDVEVVVGRSQPGTTVEADLDLSPDRTVSRRHARVWPADNGALLIEDLGSTHGTQINGEEIKGQGQRALRPGDVVMIGETTLRTESDSGPAVWRDPNKTGVRWNAVERRTIARIEPQVEIMSSHDAEAGGRSVLDTATAETARQLTLLYDLPLQFAAETAIDPLLRTIVRRLVEVIPGAAHGALVLCDRNGQLLPDAYFSTGDSSLSRTLARRAVAERRAFAWRRVEEGNISHSIIQHQIETGMYAPLLWQGKAHGAVCVDKLLLNSFFTDDDLRLLLVVAQYAAMALANQQLQVDLRDAWTGALDALTAALASRDNDTQSHCYRTVELAVEVARSMGVRESEVPTIARGALLHDIGKIAISDQILLKPGPLSDEERTAVKHHARLGYDMLKHIRFFQDALPLVLHHHEAFDGSGYPDGLQGEDIPLAARIFHVVDMYDALTHQRPYKKAWSHAEAVAELRLCAGKSADPAVVAAFEQLEPELAERIRNLQAFSPATRGLLSRGIN